MFSRTSPSHSLSRFLSGRNPYCQVFLEPDNGANNNGGDNNQSQNPQQQNQSQANQSENNQGAASLNSVQKLLEDVLNSNRANGNWEEVARILGGRIVAQSRSANDSDQVAISKGDHALLQSAQSLLKDLGIKDFAELRTQVDTGRAAITERDDLRKSAVIEEAAKESKLKPGLLKFLTKGLDVQKREVEVPTEDGQSTKKVSQFFIVTKDGEQTTEKPILAYFKEQGEDVLNSLVVSDGGGESFQQQQESSGGVTYPAQGAGAPVGNLNFASLSAGRYEHNAPKAADAKS